MDTLGEGRYKVFLNKIEVGKDKIYIVGGGEKPHVGGIVVCRPNKKPQTIAFERHYDYIVLEPIAVAACKKYNTKCVAIGGIHLDDAKKEEIDIIIKQCEKLIKYI